MATESDDARLVRILSFGIGRIDEIVDNLLERLRV